MLPFIYKAVLLSSIPLGLAANSCNKVDDDGSQPIVLLQRSDATQDTPEETINKRPSESYEPQATPSSDSMVVDIISGGTIVYRFLDVAQWGAHHEELDSHLTRSGYGILDTNQNYLIDEDEVRVYFEFSDHNTQYLFYQNPASQPQR